MKKKVIKACAVFIVLLLNFFFWNVIVVDDNINIDLKLEMQADTDVIIQIFYSDTFEFVENKSQSMQYNATQTQELIFEIPEDTKYLRIDFGDKIANIKVSRAFLEFQGGKENIIENYENICTNENMLGIKRDVDIIYFKSIGNDPFVVFDFSNLNFKELSRLYVEKAEAIKKTVFCIAFDLMLFCVYFWSRKSKLFLKKILQNMSLILDLAKNDFRTKYAGSYLGIIWAFIQPIVTILVYWLVFQVGFRSGTAEGVPFVLWLTAGLVPWFFFNEALNGSTASLLEYSYLVKKVVFDIEIIPFIRILSAFFVHIFFVGFMLVMYLINGIFPTLEWIQLLYYSGCLVLLTIGLSYATSALVIFFKDLAQIIIVVLQVGMWLTPIMWNLNIMPSRLQWIFKLNPLCYIVQGYREALIEHKWFWNNVYQTILFWVIALGCFWFGNKVFSRLKIHFADVI